MGAVGRVAGKSPGPKGMARAGWSRQRAFYNQRRYDQAQEYQFHGADFA